MSDILLWPWFRFTLRSPYLHGSETVQAANLEDAWAEIRRRYPSDYAIALDPRPEVVPDPSQPIPEIIAANFVSIDETWRGCVRCPWTYRGADAQEAMLRHLGVDHPDWRSEPVPVQGEAETAISGPIPPKVAKNQLVGEAETPSPQWGEVHISDDGYGRNLATVYGDCGDCSVCVKYGPLNGVTVIDCIDATLCESHRFADLDSGLSKIHEARGTTE